MALDKEYNTAETPKKWQQFWEKTNLYKFNIDSGKPIFSIDTPPPTVSGRLHIGHVSSYTQTEVIARYKRMKGFEVFYPMCFDNNGLPTELLTEKDHGVKATDMSREDFNKLCTITSEKFVTQYSDIYKSLGFSCSWDEVYHSIDERSQRVSQRSFIDLYNKGYVYPKEAPALWCTKCQTSFAQAEVEDKQVDSMFHYINFKAVGTNENIPIATTRPELLSSCVAIFVHPENEKYKHLIGTKAITPIFGQEVTVRADEKANPEKGTGVVMCCTFGDTTDIEWWRKHNLDLRISFTDDGKMTDLAGEFKGLYIKEARKAIAKKLLEDGITFKQEPIPADKHPVNTHERCGTDVEYLVKKQWFVKVIENKEKIIEEGCKVVWHPEHMKSRFVNWVSSLAWDWCISRQRYFGVPIPAWTCNSCKTIVIAKEEDLPVNPLTDEPRPSKCPQCGNAEFTGESDVLDTWATSSISPQVNCKWGEKDDRMDKLFPMSMRPQAHDIIRTWAFYTIVKSLYHHGKMPWDNAVISGHVVKKAAGKGNAQMAGQDFARKSKISKSKDGEEFAPQKIMSEHDVDCIRYWTCGANLGTDVFFNADELKDARKVLIKLWNAGKYTIENLEKVNFTKSDCINSLGDSTKLNFRPVDIWILERLRAALASYNNYFNNFEFHGARSAIYDFFFADYCDNYLEFSKARFTDENVNPAERKAAEITLYTCFFHILQMFAPFMPHITEELYQNYFKQFENLESLHVSIIPDADRLAIIEKEQNAEQLLDSGDLFTQLVSAIRAYKTSKGFSLKLPLDKFAVFGSHETHALVKLTAEDLKSFGVISEIEYFTSESEFQNTHDRVDLKEIKLGFTPDRKAVELAATISAIKTAANALKKEAGLTGKAEISSIEVYSHDSETAGILQENKDKITYATSAKSFTFASSSDAMISVANKENIFIKISV